MLQFLLFWNLIYAIQHGVLEHHWQHILDAHDLLHAQLLALSVGLYYNLYIEWKFYCIIITGD